MGGRGLDGAVVGGHVVGAVDLGDEDGVGAGLRGRGQVVGAPGGVEAVAADDHLAASEPAGFQGLDRLGAGHVLGVGGDGVFQVQDDHVAVQRLGLLDGLGVGGGHVEGAAARPDGIGHGLGGLHQSACGESLLTSSAPP